MSKFIILQLAGFGDTLSAIARLPSVKEKYPQHEIIFYLGGYGKSVQFSKEQIEREGYKANIIKNFNFHNQIQKTKELLEKNLLSEGDILEDWSFCEEIFNNKTPIFYKYDLKIPYNYKTTINPYDFNLDYTPDKTIAVHPLTKTGNAEGFESDLNNGRFWNRDEWKSLCIHICNKGYIPAFVGHGDEDWGLIDELTEEGYKVLDKRMGIEDTIYFLKTVRAGVFCNSWDWEVTSRAGIPTFCFYTKNNFFIQNHIPHGPSDFWNNCYIETRRNDLYMNNGDSNISGLNNDISHQTVVDKIMFLIENKKRPNIVYDICMISYNDQDHIDKTLDNLSPYIKNKFCVVDGGSKDDTVDIIKKIIPEESLIIKHIQWNNKFDVQKNNSIELAEKDWIIFIDADETYEDLFWNQISWYIREAENNDFDCINVSRINTYYDLDREQLESFVEKQRWSCNSFGWVNYPDFQQRVFKKDKRFDGSVHEMIKNYKTQSYLYPVNCIHKKSINKQIKSFKLYEGIEKND